MQQKDCSELRTQPRKADRRTGKGDTQATQRRLKRGQRQLNPSEGRMPENKDDSDFQTHGAGTREVKEEGERAKLMSEPGQAELRLLKDMTVNAHSPGKHRCTRVKERQERGS